MIKKYQLALLTTMWFITNVVYGANNPTVMVFSISAFPIVNFSEKTPICYMDEYSKDLLRLNDSIKSERNINRNVFMSEYSHELKRLSFEANCLYQAKALGIKKLPAIVFNSQYVIYGVTDINRAVAIFHSKAKGEHS